MTSTRYLKIKKSSLIYYSLSDQKRYNDRSKENLKQYQPVACEQKEKELNALKTVGFVDCVNEYTVEFLAKFKAAKNKDFKRNFSLTQQKKISDATNTFIDVVRHNYRREAGLKQRMVTFVTLTIPENQRHTDKVLVKTLVDFIDHLKKVKNTLIENKVDTGIELLRLRNYVWRAETTEAGNIHFHLLLDTYFNHTTLKRVWNNYLENLGYKGGENAANIHQLKNVKDVGGYVTKYLTKEPLNDEFTDLLKRGVISRADLDNYDAGQKYRRPVLYTSWGCSRDLKTLSAPTFSGNVINDFNDLKNMCTPVELPEEIKDFVKIYKGKIYDLVKTCNFVIKQHLRLKFKSLYDYLYNKTDEYKDKLAETVWLSRVDFSAPVIVRPSERSASVVRPFIPKLFND